MIVENPPSAALPCDRALVGDWQSDDADLGAQDERRLRIDANCRAYLPANYTPREVDLGVFKAGGERYIGLKIADVSALIAGRKGTEEAGESAELKKYPHMVSLVRYRVDDRSLSIDVGDHNELSRVTHARDIRENAVGETPDFLTGKSAQIRKQLREHPELFERPGRGVVYRFQRVSPGAR
ncbi:hypothetical protein [Lysobacter sp. CA199]|uniref:hypothetical protein n=1 Tax=Lysobacter sp. CA199 TaxID=3455608 RepID=UPI003F8D124B